MSKIIHATLGDIGSVRMCKRVLKEQTSHIGDIPFYKISTFGGKADTYISREMFEDYKKRFNYPKAGDILISAAGTLGRTVIYNGEESYFQDSNIVWIENDETKVLNRYLYYFYRIIQWKKTPGSTIERLYNENIAGAEIFYPESLEEQEKVIAVLSAIDSKINTNNLLNSELESMAKTIYDYWFLQFEFPNDEGKPYKSSGGKMVWNDELKREIPEGWEVRKYCEISTTVTGKEDANFATANGEYAYFTCGADILKCDEFKFDGKAILIAGNGDFNVKYYNGKFNAYQRTYVLMPDEKFIGILYQASLRKVNQFKSGSNGSIVKFITKGNIDGIELIIPNKEGMLEAFNIILDTIQNNNRQNQELASLRDFLLPMLMNGQVTFKEKK